MGRKGLSTLVLSVTVIVLLIIMLPALLPAGPSGGLDGQGIRWRSNDLYRAPLGVDEDGNVYALIDTPGDPVRSDDPRLVSLDASGTERWEYRVQGYGLNVITDGIGRTYLLESDAADNYQYGQEHILTILDQDGTISMSLDLSSRHNASTGFKLLHASSGALYYASDAASPDEGAELCAIDLNGTELWSMVLPGKALSVSPISVSDGVLAAATEKGVYLIDIEGSIVRAVNVTDGRILAAPSISKNGTLYLAVHHDDMFLPGEVWAIGPEGNEMWARGVLPEGTYAMDCIVTDLLLSSDGTLYVVTTGGTRTGVPSSSYDPYNSTMAEYRWIPPRLLAFDHNGHLAWAYDLEGDVRGRLVEMDDRIVACTSNGILVFSPDGSQTDRYTPPSGSLTGMVLTEEGHFYYVQFINSGVALVFSDGLPRVTIVDWLLAYKVAIALVSIVAVLSASTLMLYRRRRRRSG